MHICKVDGASPLVYNVIHMENIKNDIFFKVGQWCLMALAFLFPLWFLPTTLAPVEFNKAFLLPILVFLAFVLYLIDSIKNGKINAVYHWILWILIALVLSWLVSALVAGFPQALWGGGAPLSSFFDIFTFALLSFMVAVFFTDSLSLEKLFFSFFLGLALFIVSVWIFSVFGLGKFLGGFFTNRAFHAMGSWNSAGFAAAFFVIMLYPFLGVFKGKALALLYALFFLGLFLALYVGAPLPLIILGVFGLLLLSYSVWKRLLNFSAVVIPVLLILFSIFGYLFRANIANVISFPAPTEVSVSPIATWRVSAEGLKANLLFGKGPGSFGYLWDEFKPLEINGTIFWGVRFVSGFSYLLTLLGELGLLPWALFLAFLGALWFFSVKSVSRASDNSILDGIAFFSFLSLSFTILMFAFYAPNYSLAGLGFWSIGFALASLCRAGIIKKTEVLLFSEGPKGFISALLVVLLIIIGIGGVYWASARYIGQVAFAKALDIFNRSGNLDAAEKNILLALRADRNNDVYLRSLSDVYMLRAKIALQDKTAAQDLLGSRFKDALDKAISANQAATLAAPYDFQNFEALGKIYEFLAQLNTTGAADAALAQYDEALKHSPKNPLLWKDKALIHLASFTLKKDGEFLKKAEDVLLKAVELKPDYAEGHFILAQIYDAEGRTVEAIERGRAAALLSPNDIGTLFQLGLLYYRSDRLPEAEGAFNQALIINTNYSNARYFLGLIYGRTGRQQQAISEFEKIVSLNQDNDEVKKILSNLRAGKAALSGITPPGPSPEKRKELPVKESSGQTQKNQKSR